MKTGDAYFFGHLVPSYYGLAYVLLVENNLFPQLVDSFFRTMHFQNPSLLPLDFASDTYLRKKTDHGIFQ